MPSADTLARLEAWTLPSSGSLVKVVDLPIPYELMSFEQRLRGVTTGRLEIDGMYANLDLICDPDNEVECLLRVFERTPADPTYYNTQSFIGRFLDDEYVVNANAVIAGPDIKDELDRYLVYPFDWGTYDLGVGSAITGMSTFLDTYYGGQNLLDNPGFEDGGLSNSMIGMSTDHTTGNFSITYDGQTTAAIDVAAAIADPGVIEAAMIALSNVVDVDVNGTGEINVDPWLMEFIDPGEQLNPLPTINNISLAGGTVFNVVYKFPTGGRGRPDPWYRSTNPNTGENHGGYVAFDLSGPAHSGSFALGIDPAPGTNYSGAQQEVDVEGRGIYNAEAWIYSSGPGQEYALVIRDMNEKLISRVTIFPAEDTYTKVSIPAVAIPHNITRVLFRVSVVTEGVADRPPFWIDDCVFAPGLVPTTAGQIMLNLKTTAAAEGRPLATWLVFGFTGLVDPDGNTWDRDDIALLIPLGATWLNVLEMLEREGYESVIVWDEVNLVYTLLLYNKDGAGTHRELDPHPVFSVPAVRNAYIRKQSPRANRVLAEGPGGMVLESIDLASSLPRREAFISVDNALNLETLQSYADHEMDRIKAEKYTVKILDTDIAVGLGLHCQVGDTVHVDLPPKVPPMDLRIASVMTTYRKDQVNPIRTIDLGKEVFREERGGTTSPQTSEAVNYLLRQLKMRRPTERTGGGGGGVGGDFVIPWTIPGQLFLVTGRLGIPLTFHGQVVDVMIRSHNAPTGADIIMDLRLNATSLFNVAERPRVAAGATVGEAAYPGVHQFKPGDYLVPDVVQTGSTLPGGDVVMAIRLREVSVGGIA